MNIEKIFRNIPALNNISLDTILFESKYPVLFTCKSQEDIYLFICCRVDSSMAQWIGTRTDYETLIDLLENKITIQSAFLSVTKDKMMIEFDGRNVRYEVVQSKDIPDKLLPTVGEYMEAEADEYAEEIEIFKFRNRNMEYNIQMHISTFLEINTIWERVCLADDYFDEDLCITDEIQFSIKKIRGLKAAFL